MMPSSLPISLLAALHSNLTASMRPPRAADMAASFGIISLQGPHQVVKKSTTTRASPAVSLMKGQKVEESSSSRPAESAAASTEAVTPPSAAPALTPERGKEGERVGGWGG